MRLRCSCCRLGLRHKFRVSIRTGMDMGSVAGSVAGSGAGSGAGLGGMGIGRGSGTGLGPGACGTGTGAGPVSGTRKSLGMGRDRNSTCLRRGPPTSIGVVLLTKTALRGVCDGSAAWWMVGVSHLQKPHFSVGALQVLTCSIYLSP